MELDYSAKICYQVRKKSKTNITGWCIHLALLNDWYFGLSASFVVGQRDFFGFGFYNIQLKPTLNAGLYMQI